MDNKVIVGLVIVVAIFLGLPLVAGLKAPPPQPAAKQSSSAPKPGSSPPLLNAANLVGSVWEIEPQRGIKVQVTLNPSGQAVAFSNNPLIKQMAGTDTLAGSWKVNGAKLNVATIFQGKSFATDLDIIGDRIYSKDGIEILRLR